MSDAAWFAVRTFAVNNEEKPWGPHDLQPDQLDYEERITLWRATDVKAAIAMAEEEAHGYVQDLGGEVLSLTQAYAMFAEPGHGAEVFSLIRRSELTTDAYLDRHFDTGTEHQSRASG